MMRPVMDYPVEIKNVFFTRSIVIAIPDHIPDGTQILKISPVNNIDIKKVEGHEDQYTVSMHTLFNQDSEASAPYMIDIECIAVFKVDTTISEEERIKRLTITGHSVIYGAIREAVAWITSRQPYGPLNLGLSILNHVTKPADNESQTQTKTS